MVHLLATFLVFYQLDRQPLIIVSLLLISITEASHILNYSNNI